MTTTSILRETDSELRSTAWWFSGSSRLEFSRTERAYELVVGFIGSEELYRALLPECPVHLLTRANWQLSLESGAVDLVLFEPCLRDVTGEWSNSTFDGNAASDDFMKIFSTAREVGIPSACWITSDASYHDLQAPFAALADATFCADPAFAELLVATHLPQTIQPSLHNPFLDLGDRAEMPKILFLGWTSVAADKALAEALRSFVPLGLRIAEPYARIRLFKSAVVPGLQEAFLGAVGLRDRLILLKRAKVLIQDGDDPRPRQSAERTAIEAAACQCVVLHRGHLDPRDARASFAKSFACWEELRAFAQRLSEDRLLWLQLAQIGWRMAQEQYAVTNALGAIFAALGRPSDILSPCASVVTPTFRPELLGKVLDQFRRQTWADKELVVVANTNDRSLWPCDLLEPENREQIVFLPRERWAGTAMNVGTRRTCGAYVFRMDDDDHYGANYLGDMMLHARSTGADVLSTQAEFVFSDQRQTLFRRPGRAFPPTVFSSSDFSYKLTPMGGFTMAIRREVALSREYPDLFYGFSDSRFLLREKEKGELTMAMTDSLNAIVERRKDLHSHTFQIRNQWESNEYEPLAATLEDVMSPPQELDDMSPIQSKHREELERLRDRLEREEETNRRLQGRLEREEETNRRLRRTIEDLQAEIKERALEELSSLFRNHTDRSQ